MEFDRRAQKALQIIEANGYAAFLVGGCVRDALSGGRPFDYDIAASCTPDTVIKIFKDYKHILTGKKFGTVAVVFEGLTLEITSFRKDGTYDDNRHPDSVEFCGDITADLSRRDFTVNAVACDKNLRLIDPYGGIEDIKRGVIRSVGDPAQRFKEDALRILRAVRFCSTLGFTVESNTAAAMFELKESLKNVSRERTAAEIKKAARGKNFNNAYNTFEKIFKTAYFGFNTFDDRAAAITEKAEEKVKDYAFLCGFYDPAAALKDLFYGKQKADLCGFLKDNLLKKQNDVRSVLQTVNYDDFALLLALKDAYKINCESEKAQYQNIIQNRLCCKISELAIDGNDILSLGFSGNDVGKMLQKALYLVTKQGVKNNKKDILDRLKNI